MEYPVLSPTIGARNPYVAAEHILKKKINWRKKHPDNKIKLLETAFGRPYHELFDPRYGSPLFPKQKRLVKNREISVGAGDTTSCSPNPCPSFTRWDPLPNATVTPDKAVYNDLIQGCLPNCYFIAALSSFAWATQSQPAFQTKNTKILASQQVLPDASTGYTFQFCSPAMDGTNIILNKAPVADPSFTISEKIPLSDTGAPIYSRSNNSLESWPCLFEKAYATWRYSKINNLTPDYKVIPDYLSICKGNPLTSLLHLTGMITTLNTSMFYTAGMTGDQIYTKIAGQYSPVKLRAKTDYATVAWTYDPAIDKVAVTYNDDIIVANHAYSVLGVFQQNKKNFIVLRNPWGQKHGDPTRITATDTSTTALVSSDFAEGTCPFLSTNLNDPNDGIFGISADKFQMYFAGFGWVK